MGFLSKVFGQIASKVEYQPNWTFYFSNVNNKLSSIATDLNLVKIAPVKGQETVFYVSIKMNSPRKDGLSSNEEADKLREIEDKIMAQFDEKNLSYTFAGRLTSDGLRDLYFFGEDTIQIEKEVSSVMIAFPNYEFDFGRKFDKMWAGDKNSKYPAHILSNLRPNSKS